MNRLLIISMILGLCLGGTATAAITLSPIYPQADAHVYSAVPASNYGTNASLLVSKAFASGYLTGQRQTYIKFALSSLAGYSPMDVLSVTLNLYVNTTAGGPVMAYHSGDVWAETEITWNNKPSLAGEPYMGASPNLTPNNQYHSIDLLAGGSGWLAGDMSDGYLSIAMLLPAEITESTAYYFSSKETNPAYKGYRI